MAEHSTHFGPADDSDPTSFGALFGRPPEVTASAPGRVNLLGEHTDYNGGLVLPTVIDRSTDVRLARRSDRLVDVYSTSVGGRSRFEIDGRARSNTWTDYVQGVTRALLEHGHTISGVDLWIGSDVPLGSGLSSSASLQVAVLRGLRALFSLALDDLDIARLAQWSENHHVGVPVGALDPMACSLAAPRRALFIDMRSLRHESIVLPDAVDLLVVDSGQSHRHASGGYRVRRAECEQAAAILGVDSLRDVGPEHQPDIDRLPAALHRRVRHVLSENARVLEGVAALRSGDVEALGRAFAASHVSMRDDFEVSTAEIDALVARASADHDVIGARLTGGGFGGSIVVLTWAGRARDVAHRICHPPATIVVPR